MTTMCLRVRAFVPLAGKLRIAARSFLRRQKTEPADQPSPTSTITAGAPVPPRTLRRTDRTEETAYEASTRSQFRISTGSVRLLTTGSPR